MKLITVQGNTFNPESVVLISERGRDGMTLDVYLRGVTHPFTVHRTSLSQFLTELGHSNREQLNS